MPLCFPSFSFPALFRRPRAVNASNKRAQTRMHAVLCRPRILCTGEGTPRESIQAVGSSSQGLFAEAFAGLQVLVEESLGTEQKSGNSTMAFALAGCGAGAIVLGAVGILIGMALHNRVMWFRKNQRMKREEAQASLREH